MNSISASFNECSAEIKRWLQREPGVKAETLTHWLLSELSKLNKNIHYKPFAFEDQERKERAYWQWWFVLSNTVSFAANALAMKAENTEVLNTILNDSDPAFYVLFSTNDEDNAKCKNGKSLDGIFLAEANKMREVVNENNNLLSSQMLSFSNPASCIVGCPGIYGEGMNKEEGFRWHVGNYYPMMCDEGEGRKSGFRETPEEILTWIESGVFPDTLRSVKSNAILAFDLRN